jgi:hypothetical protein
MLALVASLIARRQYGISPDAAYTYALFHDAGVPLMMRRFPELRRVAGRCLTERQAAGRSMEEEYFPCTHPIISSLLVRNWGLPAILGQAIRFHHDNEAYDLPDRTLPGGALSLIAVTQVAERLLCEHYWVKRYRGGRPYLFERALDFLGISGDDVRRPALADRVAAIETRRLSQPAQSKKVRAAS